MKKSGAKILVETLIKNNVDTIFGYPGGAVLNIYDELYSASDKIEHIVTSHEQGAAHAADGYARATGKTGVVIATSGPGATNLVTGIANAYLDSSPMVAITGNVSTGLLGKDSFQEIDIIGVTMPITKHNYIVRDIKKLSKIVDEAFELANSGRPGPVLIDIPKDIQIAEIEFEIEKSIKNKKKKSSFDSVIQKAISIIESAKKPFIYAGGGVVISNASEELFDFAKKIDAPIGTSMMGLSCQKDDKMYLGMTGMHGKYAASKAMSESDLIIAIGTRFSDRATGNKEKFCQGRKILHIDIDPAEIGKNVNAYVSLIGDVKEILNDLNNQISKLDNKNWKNEVENLVNQPDNHLDMDNSRLNPQMVIESVNKYASSDTVVATDVGQHQMWTAQYYKFSKPRTFMTSGGLGTMGFGLGAAIGACVGTNQKTVLFTSDGCFHMNLNELATVVSNDLPIVVVVMNNNALGMVRQWQTIFFDKRYSNTTLDRKTDYVKLAEAFGMKGVRVENIEDLDGIVQDAFAGNEPILIDAVIDSDEKVLPMIPPNGSINEIILK